MTLSDGWPSPDDIEDAAIRLQGVARRTPLLESDDLNARANARLLLKCEMFQPMGAFKIRGAWNTVSNLSVEQRKRGVVTFSSGNHAQAVALAASRLGIPATIVMPSDAPQIKIARTRQYGGTVLTYDRLGNDREAIAAERAAATGATMIPPYDHPDVIAGQGTVGLEIVQQCREIGVRPDAAIVPCSGGGLVAGCALVLRKEWPDIRIYAAEPEGFDDTARSLKSGQRETNLPGATSICDALLVPAPGELTFEINRALLTGGLAVSDMEVISAIRHAFSDARLVTEPGGATGLAAALHAKADIAGKTVCIVLSGGNIDPLRFAEFLK